MHLVAKNDAAAFQIVLERHADAAFSLAYRMIGRRSLAEDATQEAFLSLWRTGASYDHNRGSVRTWTLRIVHNRAIDTLRRDAVHDSAAAATTDWPTASRRQDAPIPRYSAAMTQARSAQRSSAYPSNNSK